MSNVRQIAVNQITGQSSLFEGAFQGVLHPQSLEGRWASMSPFGALVCLALLATLPACRAQFFFADRYNGELTSGQLTVSPFSFTGVSLSPNQKCLSYESDGSSLVNLSPCSGSMDTSILGLQLHKQHDPILGGNWARRKRPPDVLRRPGCGILAGVQLQQSVCPSNTLQFERVSPEVVLERNNNQAGICR